LTLFCIVLRHNFPTEGSKWW